jgi:SSS family solute:Na+ symporter
MFTHDIIVRLFGEQRIGDKQRIFLGRALVVAIVTVAYLLSLVAPATVYTLGVWCFSGFAALFPLVFASLYWKRVTKAGAMASILTAALIWVLLFGASGWGAKPQYLFLGMLPAATMVICSAISLVLVSLLTRPPAEEVVARFFPETVVTPLGGEIQPALETVSTPLHAG